MSVFIGSNLVIFALIFRLIMSNIQLVDLLSQYHKIEDEINTAVIDVIRSGQFIGGEQIKNFTNNLENKLGVKHVIPVANGTDALQIALMAADLKPGDEVITPSYTYIATAEVIALLNLTPKFIEVDPQTFTIDVNKLEEVVTEKTKAIIPVHLYGQCANMQPILDFAKKHNLTVIEDTAQAINAEHYFEDGSMKKAGCIGHMGTTSFFPSKNLGAFGDGGAMFTNDDDLAAKIRMIANHGQKVKYQHDIIGCNSRLDTIQAAILDIKLKHLDSYIHARQYAAGYYDAAFQNVDQLTVPFRAKHSNHTFHQYTMVVDTQEHRDGLMKHLNENGVPSNIYYPIPIHKQKGFQQYQVNTDLSLTEDLCSRVISLPMHTELTDEQLDKITNTVINYFKS